MLEAATTQAEQLQSVWNVFLWSGIAVALLVYGLIVWCLFRYRKRPQETAFPKQFRRNNRAEILYTLLPIIIVCGLFAFIYPIERNVEAIVQHPDLRVHVTAFRWSWRFDYPQYHITLNGNTQNGPILELPVGETTRLTLSSVDVDHSFWVPAFLFKRDAIPGFANVFDWTPTKLGTFRGECGEFCGLDHAHMSFLVDVVPRADFDRWIRSKHS